MIIGCSEKEEITGAVVTEDAVSVLIVKVIDEDDNLMGGVNVYVNDEFKGRTSKYGESKGTQKVLLNGADNQISVEMNGFSEVEPKMVSASSRGTQQISFALEKERGSFKIVVEDMARNKLKDAQVSLLSRGIVERVITTNRAGEASFVKLDEGKYSFRIKKSGYSVKEVEYEIFDAESYVSTVELMRLPELSVEVVDDHGQLLPGVEVTLFTRRDYNSPGTFPLHIKYTNSKGVVRFDDVELEEDYVVILKKESFSAQIHEITVTPDDHFLHIGMEE